MLGFLRANPYRTQLETLPDAITIEQSADDDRTLFDKNRDALKRAAGVMDDHEAQLVEEIAEREELLRQVRISKRAYLAGVEIMEASDVDGN